MIDQTFDFKKGMIFEGVIYAESLSQENQESYVGFYLNHIQEDQGRSNFYRDWRNRNKKVLYRTSSQF